MKKLYRVRIVKAVNNQYVELKDAVVNSTSKKKAVSSVLSENEGFRLYSADSIYIN